MWLPSGYAARTTLEVKRSRFVTLLTRTDDEDAAREAIAAERHRYPEARHHCTAFIVEVPGSLAVERSSDDGEPAGTAGMPMLEVLRGSGLTNATTVVTRWFGGIKLGTGGLVRAYSESVAQALATAPRVTPVTRTLQALTLDHAEAGRVRSELEARGAVVVDARYDARVTLVLTHADESVLAGAVAAATRGDGTLRVVGTQVVEQPTPPVESGAADALG